MDFVTCEGTEPLVPVMDVLLARQSSLLANFRGAGQGFPGKGMDQVEDVRAQDPKVFRTTPVVLLSPSPQGDDFSKKSIRNQFLRDVQGGVITVAMGDRQFRP
jgi:hypothetical protein